MANSGRMSVSSQVILGARPGDWTVDQAEQVAGFCLTQSGSQAVAHQCVHLILLITNLSPAQGQKAKMRFEASVPS